MATRRSAKLAVMKHLAYGNIPAVGNLRCVSQAAPILPINAIKSIHLGFLVR